MSFIREPELIWAVADELSFAVSATVAFTDQPIEVDDLQVVIISNQGTGGIAAPAGWTKIADAGDFATNDIAIQAFYRVADGSADDTANVVFTDSAVGEWIVWRAVWRYVDPDEPIPVGTTIAISEVPAGFPFLLINTATPEEPRPGTVLVMLGAFDDPTLGYSVTTIATAPNTWQILREQAGAAPGLVNSSVIAQGSLVFVDNTNESGGTIFRGVPGGALVHANASPAGGGAGFSFPLNPRRGRPVHELLERLQLFLPPEYVALVEHLAGRAAQFSLIEEAGCVLIELATVGGGTGTWLTLHAEGIGIFRADSETDTSLRRRIRGFVDAVTEPVIVDAVQAIYGSVSGQPDAFMIEWFDGPYADVSFADALDAVAVNEPPAFTMVVPDLGSGTFTESEHQSAALAINALRAAGVRFSMILFENVVADAFPNRASPIGSPVADVVGDPPATAPLQGMNAFTADDYLEVDGELTGHASNRKLWAIKFQWNTTSPTEINNPLLGIPVGGGGVAVYLTSAGGVVFGLWEGVSDTVIGGGAVGSVATSPNTNEAFWVFLEFPVVADGNPAVFAAMEDGELSLLFSESPTPTETADLDRIQFGRNTSADGAANAHAADVTILEVIEYESDGGNFTFDSQTMIDIGSGANLREPKMIRRYNNMDLFVGI